MDREDGALSNAGFWSRLRTEVIAGAQSSWLARPLRSDEADPWKYLAGLFTALSAVLFAFQRLATSWFYARLGTSAEEVGAGFTQAIEGVVVFLLLLILVNLLILIPAIMPLVSASMYISSRVRELWTAGKTNPWRTLAYILHRLAIIAVFVAGLVVFLKFKDRVNTLFWVASVAALVVLFMLGGSVHNPLTSSAPIPPRSIVVRRAINISTVVAAVLALAFVAAWIFNADREADLVKQGISISGFPSISWRTERVTVVSLASTPPAAIEKLQESCLMHLGQANGVTVMYDVTKKGVLRLPTSSIMLRTESSPCRSR
jgi:hypothetical protein